METDRARRSIIIETHAEELFRDQALYGSRVELYHALMSNTDANASAVHAKLETLMTAPMKTLPPDARAPRTQTTRQTEQKNAVVTLRHSRRAHLQRRNPHVSVVSLR